MKILIFLTTIFLTKVSGNPDPWNQLHYKSRSELYECLEISNLRNRLLVFDNTSRLGNFIMKKISGDFNYKGVDPENVDRTASRFARDAQMTFGLSNDQWAPVTSLVFAALIECSDIGNFEGRLPDFEIETTEFATLLNFILVDSRYLIAQTDGLRTLFGYVQNALIHLERCFGSLESSQELLKMLFTMFHLRSERFFDYRNEVPYIRHTYSLDRSEPFTDDDPRFFVTRRLVDLEVRRPWITRPHFSRVVTSQQSNLNTFELINSADYYYELHENQFFRIIFFFLELVERGLANLNLDNALSIHDVPEDLMQIIRNDTAFIQYLEIRYNVENSYVNGQIPRQDDQIDVVQVALAFWHRLMVYVPYLATTTDSMNPARVEDGRPDNHNRLFFPGQVPLFARILGGFLCSFAGATVNTNDECSSNSNQFLLIGNQTRVLDRFSYLFENGPCDHSNV